MIGETISHYLVLEKLGSGGMGDVYQAEDTNLKRTVALKFLPRELTLDDEAKQRFVHEAQAASALDHPNIGTIYEIDEVDGKSFIAMACYEGGTLRDRMGEGSLPIGEAVDIAIQLARGLGKAHAKEIVHRDVKPANVMLSDGHVKIVDFGLAKLAGRTLLTQTGTTLGTVAYMSPEQASGQSVDHRSDIWSIGVILHEMLAGDRPFKGEYEQAVIYSVLNSSPEFISSVRPDTPSALEKVLEKALEKDPDRRYQSCDELVAELEMVAKALDGGEDEASSQILRMSRRQRQTVTRVVGVVALVVVALAAFLWTRGRVEVEPVALAVLPLTVDGNADDAAWFGTGMTDALITELAQMENVRVISQRSVVRLASNRSVPEIGQDLKVAYVIDGSVSKVGDAVSISVRVADVATDQYIWAERFESDFVDILETQSEIAGNIAEEVLGEVSPADKERLARSRSVNPEVYEAYLRGMHNIAKYNPEDIQKGLAYLHEAVDKDPADPLAWAGLALGYVTIDHGPTAMDARQRAVAAAERAVSLDPSLPQGQAALAMTKFYYAWDWEAAESAFKRANELNPNLALNHYHYAWMQVLFGRLDEAIIEHEIAVELDPLFAPQVAWMGEIYRMAGRYDEALLQTERALELGDRSGIAHLVRGYVFMSQGLSEERIAEHERMVEVNPMWQGSLGMTYAAEGRTEDALRMVEEIESRGANTFDAWQLAALYATLGDADKAFEWLEFEPAHIFVPWLASEWMPIGTYLGDDPRYEAFLRRLKLPVRTGPTV